MTLLNTVKHSGSHYTARKQILRLVAKRGVNYWNIHACAMWGVSDSTLWLISMFTSLCCVYGNKQSKDINIIQMLLGFLFFDMKIILDGCGSFVSIQSTESDWRFYCHHLNHTICILCDKVISCSLPIILDYTLYNRFSISLKTQKCHRS